MIRTRPLAGLLLLSSVLSANDNPRNTVDFGTFTPGPGPVTRTLAGNFTEDMEPDIVLLDAGVPKISYASYLFDAATPVEPSLTNVADITTVRGISAQGEDILFATDSRGLVAVTFDIPTGTFNPPLVVAAGAWIDAAPILAAVDPGGYDLVFGIAGGDTLITQIRVGPNFVAGSTFTTTNPVLEFVALDWDADGRLELVFRTAFGLEVREMDGTLVRSIAGPELGALAVLTDGNNVDWLAWAHRTLPTSYYELDVLNEATWNAPMIQIDLRVPEQPGLAGTPLLDLDIRSLAVGDLNGNGPDIVLTHATNRSVYVLIDKDLGVGLEYHPTNKVYRFGRASSPLSAASGTLATSAVLQLNNNASADLAVVTNEDRELRVYVDNNFPSYGGSGQSQSPAPRSNFSAGAQPGGHTSPTQPMGEISKPQEMGGATGIVGASHDQLGPNPDDFNVDFNLPSAGSATHLQIVLWEQDEGMGNPVHALENTIFPLGVCTGSPFHTAVVQITQALGLSPRPYQFFQYRLVEMAGNDIIAAQESRVGVCALETYPGEFSNGQLSIRFLENNLQASVPGPVYMGGYTCFEVPDGGAILGVVYSDSLPPLPPPGTTPNPGVWNVTFLNTVNH